MKNIILAIFAVLSFSASAQKVSTLAGTTTPASFYIQNNYYNDGNPATFHFPHAVTVTPDGNAFVFEKDVPALRKISLNGFTSLYAGSKVFIGSSYTGYGFVDGTLLNSRFNNARGLASDKTGIYVADTFNGAIRKITGNTVSTIATGFTSPNGICLASDGTIYIADGTTVKKLSSGKTTLISGSTTSGNVNSTLLLSRFKNIEYIALDETNNVIYVSDTGNNALRKLDLNKNTVSNVSVVDGFFSLITPSGLVFNKGSLYVADRGGHVIFKVTDGTTKRIAGNGKPKYRDGNADTTAFGASFYSPEAIALTPDGNLVVVDPGNSRIRLITLNY